MKDENLEFKFASSHKKSVQGMIPVEAASGRRTLWSWDSNGEIRVWDTKVRLHSTSSSAHLSSSVRRSLSTRRYPPMLTAVC